MEDLIQVQDQFYILATASRAGDRSAVLQHGDTFALFDLSGDIGSLGAGEQGLYHEGTRYLSRFRLRLNDRRPLLLSARVKDDNELFGADLTNPDMPLGDPGVVISRDIVHLFRARFLWDGTCHERIRLWNYGRAKRWKRTSSSPRKCSRTRTSKSHRQQNIPIEPKNRTGRIE